MFKSIVFEVLNAVRHRYQPYYPLLGGGVLQGKMIKNITKCLKRTILGELGNESC